jgi:hypothetical protein
MTGIPERTCILTLSDISLFDSTYIHRVWAISAGFTGYVLSQKMSNTSSLVKVLNMME